MIGWGLQPVFVCSGSLSLSKLPPGSHVLKCVGRHGQRLFLITIPATWWEYTCVNEITASHWKEVIVPFWQKHSDSIKQLMQRTTADIARVTLDTYPGLGIHVRLLNMRDDLELFFSAGHCQQKPHPLAITQE